MATTYSTAAYAANTPSGTGHGIHKTNTSLHTTSGTIATWALNDVINIGWLPAGAVVQGVVLKTASQLDSNGSPTLTFDVGVTGSAALFKAAISTVGRAAGASADATITAAGLLYKTAARALVTVTVHAAAATAVAGSLEVAVDYYVEDAAGSAP